MLGSPYGPGDFCELMWRCNLEQPNIMLFYNMYNAILKNIPSRCPYRMVYDWGFFLIHSCGGTTFWQLVDQEFCSTTSSRLTSLALLPMAFPGGDFSAVPWSGLPAAAQDGRYATPAGQVGLMIASLPICVEWCFSPFLFRCCSAKPWTGGGDCLNNQA